MYKGVLFDLDNTLIIRRPTSIEVLFALCEKIGNPRKMEEIVLAYSNGENWIGLQTLHENSAGRRMSDEDFLQNLTKVYENSLGVRFPEKEKENIPVRNKAANKIEVLLHVFRVLDALKDKKFSLGIVSNNISSIRSTLEELKLADYFDTIIISQEVDLHKPDKRILLLAADRLGLKPDEYIYVGDHPFDILCAHEAGMDIAFCPVSSILKIPEGIGNPKYRIESVLQVLSVLNIS